MLEVRGIGVVSVSKDLCAAARDGKNTSVGMRAVVGGDVSVSGSVGFAGISVGVPRAYVYLRQRRRRGGWRGRGTGREETEDGRPLAGTRTVVDKCSCPGAAVGCGGMRWREGGEGWTREDAGGDALDGLDVLGQHAARWFCGTDGRSASRSVDSSDGGSAGCAVVSVVWWARLRGWERGGRGRGGSGWTTRWPWRRWLGDEECGVPYRTPYHRIILPAPHGGHHLRELQYRYAGTLLLCVHMSICSYGAGCMLLSYGTLSCCTSLILCSLSYGTLSHTLLSLIRNLSHTVLSLTVPSLILCSLPHCTLSDCTLSDCTLSHTVPSHAVPSYESRQRRCFPCTAILVPAFADSYESAYTTCSRLVSKTSDPSPTICWDVVPASLLAASGLIYPLPSRPFTSGLNHRPVSVLL